MTTRTEERLAKQERLADVRAEAGADALLLTSHEALSWYLGGIRTHISLAGPPVVAVRATDAGDEIFVAANEADRLIAEELDAADAERVVRVPWQTPVAVAAAEAGPAMPEVAVAPALRAARASLLPIEVDRYRALGAETAAVFTDAASLLSPRSTERDAAALLAAGLVQSGIDPLVVLVTGASRVGHRHPLPTDAPLGDRAMLVACGRRHGLIANVTRWVGAAGADDARILAVEAAFFAATRLGERLDDVFAAGCRAYGVNGFDTAEWQNHHQGGPTGYAGRDPRATGGEADEVRENHAFAWNPSAPDAKVEDTVLVTSHGIEVLTVDERWPTTEVAGLQRPTALSFR